MHIGEDAFRVMQSVASAGGDGQIVASEEEIAFENACVVTPADATLVRDLTLRVPAGTNLLVTGPNGSGVQSEPAPSLKHIDQDRPVNQQLCPETGCCAAVLRMLCRT